MMLASVVVEERSSFWIEVKNCEFKNRSLKERGKDVLFFCSLPLASFFWEEEREPKSHIPKITNKKNNKK